MVIAGLTGVSRLTTHKGFLQAPKATTSIDGNNTEGSRLHFTMLIDLSCRAKNTNGINKLSQLNSIKIALQRLPTTQLYQPPLRSRLQRLRESTEPVTI